jgi:predicted alpha/beta-hydrolase family hydrolase
VSSFTATKVVKHGAGASTGASIHPHFAQETTQKGTEVAQPALGASAEHDTVAAEAVHVRPEPPMEAG